MMIIYNDTKKDLPVEQLHHLFVTAGWSDSETPPDDILKNFNRPFIDISLILITKLPMLLEQHRRSSKHVCSIT